MNQNITINGGGHLNAPSLLADAAKGEIAFKHPTTNENISFKSDDYYQSIISEINNSIATVSNEIDGISSTTITNTTKITSIESNINTITGDVSTVKNDITDIQDDITTLSGKSWLYFVSLDGLSNSSPSFTINTALGGLQNAIDAIKSGCLFVSGINNGELQKSYVQPVMVGFNFSEGRYYMVFNYLSTINSIQNYKSITINGTNENDLSCSVSPTQILLNTSYRELQTNDTTIFGAINECAKKTITLNGSSGSYALTVAHRSATGTVRYGESVLVVPYTISVTSDATTSDAVAEAKAKGLRLLFNTSYGVHDIASITEYDNVTYLTFNFVASLTFNSDDANNGLYLCMSTFRWNPDNNELRIITGAGAGQDGNLIILRRLY